MVALDPVFSARIQKRCCSHYVCTDEAFRIENRAVHMALGRKVDNYVRLFLFKKLKHELAVCNIALYEFIIRLSLHRL